MKKIMMTLAVVLCCAMTTTVFTSCGDDDDDPKPNTPEQPTDNPSDAAATTPVYSYVQFRFKNTEDMLKYLDIEVFYQVNDGAPQTFGPLTDKDVDSEKTFGLESVVTFPIKLTYYRKVTVKEEFKDTFASLEKFNWTNEVVLSCPLYNVDKKLIPGNYEDRKTGTYSSSTLAPTGEKMLDNMEKGVFDYIYTVTFDEKGNVTFTHYNPKRS